jgi:hypothetical protein
MSDATIAPEPQIVSLNVEPFELAVNGRNTKFGQKFTRVVNGKKQGYCGIIEENLTTEDYITLLGGPENVKDILSAYFNRMEQNITKLSLDDDTGNFSLDEFKKFITTGRSAGETKAELAEKFDNITDQLTKLASTPGVQMDELLKLVIKQGEIKAAMDAKSRKRSAE